MKTHKNILSIIIILALVFLEVVPWRMAVAEPIQKDILRQSDSPPPTDWSKVNFNEEILLPEDLEEFHKKADELKNQGREDEIMKLSPQKRKMSDDYVLDYYNVPTEIRQNIQKYEKDTDSLSQKELLEDPNHIIDLKTAPRLEIKRIEKAPDLRAVKPIINIQKKKTQEDLFQKEDQKFYDKILNILSALFGMGTAYADFAVPLMQYYDGIGENTMDSALYYLSSIQNTDGSWGEYNQYELTAEIALLLSSFNKTNNDQFSASTQYLTATEPQNNREKAIKARLMAGLGEPYQNYLDELIAAQNGDGGFGLENNYTSDVLTTLEAASAFYIANYSLQDALPAALYFVTTQISADGSMHYTSNSDPGYYLINKTAQSLYPFRTMTVAGDNTPSVVIQDKINDLLGFLDANYDDTIDEAMTLSTFQLYEIEESAQESLRESVTEKQYYDGSFGNSLYTTVEAMAALPRPDLILTNLQNTGSLINKSAASFELTVKNIGYGVSDTAYIYNFIDNFDIENTIDFSAQGLTLAPGEEVTIDITYPDTSSFIGDTEIKFYIEDENESDYKNNWLTDNFTFAGAADGSPALPMYYIAQKYDLNGQPALNIRWPKKADPNRENYIAMFREKGTTNWNYIGISDSWNGAFLYGYFSEDQIYEITAGVLHHDQQTITYFSDIDEVQMSADPNLYTGNVIGYATVNNENLPDEYTWGFSVSDRTDDLGLFVYENAPNGSTAAGVDTDYYENIRKKISIESGQTTEDIRLFTRLVPDDQPPVIEHLEIRWKPDFVVRNQDEVELFAYGSDNVALKNADFYYWDPVEGFWLYLGTESFDGQNSVLMSWYISEDLLGTGYKIKTVFWDYQGNKSTPVEWGPFQIIDGTAPSFEILSPNGGEQWTLDSEETVLWEAESVNGISDVDLRLIYPNSITTIKNSANNTGSYTWTVPDSYNYVGDKVKVGVVGEDDVTYLESEDESDDYFSIVDNSPLPDPPWGEPETLSDTFAYDPAGGGTAMAELKYDQNGNAHVIYNYIHDQYGSPRIVTERLYYLIVNPDTGVVTQPELIYEQIWETDWGLTGYRPVRELQMELDANNRPHLLWQNGFYGGGCEGYNDQDIHYMYYNGTSWTTPENISNNNTESRNPDFDIDNQGDIHAIWIDGQTWNSACNSSGNKTIYYREKPFGTSWSSLEQLTPNQYPGYPQIAVTDNDKVHIIYWGGDPDSVSHIYKDVTWGSPVNLTLGSGMNPQLTAGTNNSLHAVYRQSQTDPDSGASRSAAMYSYYNGNSWVEPVEISPITPGYSAEYPQIAVNENSVPHITYEYYDSQASQKNLLWTTKVNGNWLDPQAVNRATQEVYSTSSRISYGSDNKISAIWRGYKSRHIEIFFNHADMSNIKVAPSIQLIEPDGVDDVADTAYTITWTDEDPDSNAIIHFFYDTDTTGQDGTAVNLATIFEDDETDSYQWDTSQVPEGDYYIYAVIDDEETEPVVVYSNGTITVHHESTGPDPVEGTVYEDAEDGSIARWTIYDNDPPGAVINNVYDTEKGSRVIEFIGGYSTTNGYRLKNEANLPWNNTSQFTIQWDQKYSEKFTVIVEMQTTAGPRKMYYNYISYDGLGSNLNVHHGLGADTMNGEWQTITRDLEADLHEAQPNVDIISVNSFIIQGNGRVDNIKLIGETVEDENLDTDGDGLTDTEEINTYGTNPNLSDTDGDGLNDYEEINTYNTNPNLPDTDGDSTTDGDEIYAGTDPNDATSFPTQTMYLETIYEDAEDGSIARWSIYDNDPEGAVINNIYDAEKGSRAIEFIGAPGTINGYVLPNQTTGAWNNTEEFTLQWDQKYSETYYIYIGVQTTAGNYTMHYNPLDHDVFIANGSYVHHGLGASSMNGEWQTFTRDLEADLHDSRPNVNIISVNSFRIRGNGRVDNIKLIGETVEDENLDTDGDGVTDGDEINAGTDPNDATSFPTETIVPGTVYEDAEDGNINRWELFKDDPAGMSINNIYDTEKGSRVIEFITALGNGYTLFKSTGDNWNNTEEFILQWEQKYSGNYYIYIGVQTTAGNYTMHYNPLDHDVIITNGPYVHHGLGTSSMNGEWQTFTRNLEADIHDSQPNVDIIAVNFFRILGNGRVDNIKLLQESP